jgi:hypothetical protein
MYILNNFALGTVTTTLSFTKLDMANRMFPARIFFQLVSVAMVSVSSLVMFE